MATLAEALAAGGKLAEIVTVQGSFGSGMATMVVAREDGCRESLYADNGPLIRALDSAFGDVIQEGHRFNPQAVAGKKIVYFMDDMGLCLAGFLRVEGNEEDGYEVVGEDE